MSASFYTSNGPVVGGAVVDRDYVATNATLVFTNGETARSFAVTVFA